MKPLSILGIDPRNLWEAPTLIGTPKISDRKEEMPLLSLGHSRNLSIHFRLYHCFCLQKDLACLNTPTMWYLFLTLKVGKARKPC